jgi:endonuclease YncB( thermonuclease family)
MGGGMGVGSWLNKNPQRTQQHAFRMLKLALGFAHDSLDTSTSTGTGSAGGGGGSADSVQSVPLEEMSQLQLRGAVRLSLAGQQGWVRVADVYDGDTLTVVAPLLGGDPATGAPVHRISVRLAGIDACELRDPEEGLRARAYAARNRVVELLLGVRPEPERAPAAAVRRLFAAQVCAAWVDCAGTDKYGRTLATVSSARGAPCITHTLLEEGLAQPYNGRGPRPSPHHPTPPSQRSPTFASDARPPGPRSLVEPANVDG